jgi:hypothetical protein
MLNRILFVCVMLAVQAATAGPPLPVIKAATKATTKSTARAVLTLAEPPLRLIRGATVYKAGSGVALLADDILETGAGAAQAEAGPAAIIALGPQTRVLVKGLAPVELNVLQGWVKVLSTGRALLVTPALQVAFASGAAIVGAGTGQDAVFAEEGEQQAARIDAQGRAGPPLKLASEQYAAVVADKPQLAPGRPPRAFVAAMPASFRDRLARAPAVPNGGKVAPVREREADYADVAPWLQASLPARRGFVARFKPRLADVEFRRQVERTLGQGPDWKPLLHPARPATTNALF